MKKIKFRAWHKEGKRMFTPVSLLSNWNDEKGSYDVETKDTAYMQFTGLYDKFGVEIYEGDVLRLGKDAGVVFWNPTYAEYWVRFKEGDKTSEMPLWEEASLDNDDIDCEVIGNIYQNPNLLTNQNE